VGGSVSTTPTVHVACRPHARRRGVASSSGTPIASSPQNFRVMTVVPSNFSEDLCCVGVGQRQQHEATIDLSLGLLPMFDEDVSCLR